MPPEGSEGLRGFLILFRAWEPMLEKIEKVLKECFAQHVDGAPSTAPSEMEPSPRVE